MEIWAITENGSDFIILHDDEQYEFMTLDAVSGSPTSTYVDAYNAEALCTSLKMTKIHQSIENVDGGLKFIEQSIKNYREGGVTVDASVVNDDAPRVDMNLVHGPPLTPMVAKEFPSGEFPKPPNKYLVLKFSRSPEFCEDENEEPKTVVAKFPLGEKGWGFSYGGMRDLTTDSALPVDLENHLWYYDDHYYSDIEISSDTCE